MSYLCIVKVADWQIKLPPFVGERADVHLYETLSLAATKTLGLPFY